MPESTSATTCRHGVDLDRGRLELRDADADRDGSLLERWLNCDHVRDRYQLDEPRDGQGRYSSRQVRRHLERLSVSEHEQASIGSLDGVDVSYWETYDVGHSPLAGYPGLDDLDRAVHLIIGSTAHVGRGLASVLLRAVAEWQLDGYPAASRVAAEPNVRNAVAIRAFRRSGFRQLGMAELPDKRAVVMALQRHDVSRMRVA